MSNQPLRHPPLVQSGFFFDECEGGYMKSGLSILSLVVMGILGTKASWGTEELAVSDGGTLSGVVKLSGDFFTHKKRDCHSELLAIPFFYP